MRPLTESLRYGFRWRHATGFVTYWAGSGRKEPAVAMLAHGMGTTPNMFVHGYNWPVIAGVDSARPVMAHSFELGDEVVNALVTQTSTSRPGFGISAMRRLWSRKIVSTFLIGLAAAGGACAGAGRFIWVDEAPAVFFSPPPGLLISSGDLISIRVFGQEPLSGRSQVRADGMIALPLIGDVVVAGKSPGAVAKEIEARLVPFVNSPNVVVVIEESRTRIVAIGEIHRPGTLVLEAGETGLLPALANAGGLTDFASSSGVYVLRSDSSGTFRIRFQYDDIIRGVGRAAAFKLRNGDQIVVE